MAERIAQMLKINGIPEDEWTDKWKNKWKICAQVKNDEYLLKNARGMANSKYTHSSR